MHALNFAPAITFGATPSPRSVRGTRRSVIGLSDYLLNRGDDLPGVWNVELLQRRAGRDGNIRTCDAAQGRFQLSKGLLHDDGGDFSGEAPGADRLM